MAARTTPARCSTGFAKRIGHFCARLLFRIRIRDIDCDYRLIRRDLLDQIHLTSTSGTICVELVRKLELSGCEVNEVGVHHYPRLYGRSQFFRVKSLAITFSQLLRLWFRLVIRSRRNIPAVGARSRAAREG